MISNNEKDNGVGEEGAKALAEGLKWNTSVWWLNMEGEVFNKQMKMENKNNLHTQTGNKIGKGITAFSEMLEQNTTITALFLDCLG